MAGRLFGRGRDIGGADEASVPKVPRRESLPAPVYYVESDDDTVLVGIDVTISRQEGFPPLVRWFDTTRERSMYAAEVGMSGDSFWFIRIAEEGGHTYTFTPMIIGIYDERVRHRLIHGGSFDNEEDLIAAFLDTRRG